MRDFFGVALKLLAGLFLLAAAFMSLAAYFVWAKDGFFAALLFAAIFVAGPAYLVKFFYVRASALDRAPKKSPWDKEPPRVKGGSAAKAANSLIERVLREKARAFPWLRRAYFAFVGFGLFLLALSGSMYDSIRGEGAYVAWLVILGAPALVIFFRAAYRRREELGLGRREWLIVAAGCAGFLLALRGYLPFLNATDRPTSRAYYQGSVVNKWECGRAGSGRYCVTIMEPGQRGKTTLSVGRSDYERTPIGGQFRGDFARGNLGVAFRRVRRGE